MKIGFDAIAMVGVGGNSTYSRELIEHIVSFDDENDYILFSFLHDLFKKSQGRTAPVYLSKSFFPLPRLAAINAVLLRLAARMRGVEVMHFTNPLNFTHGHFKSVVTVHDLAALREPMWVKENSRRVFKKYAENIAMHADAIIAVSEATKRDCIELLGITSEKITVVYEAAGKDYFPDLDMPFVKNTFGTENYFLYVGQLQPRKNILKLIEAWAHIASRVPTYKLILVGSARDEEYLTQVKAAVADGGVSGSVVLAGNLDNAAVRKLYSNARALVYPSLFEGFGLPIVEALACGTPVITSNVSSLPEAAGDVGILVDPTSAEAIADALVRVATDGTLYADLKSRVPAQSKKFSWDKSARETVRVYRSL